MQRITKRAAGAAAMVILLIGLAACGGGGSDGGGSTGNDTGGDAGFTSRSGLVPQPPTPGAVLAADASSLRPLLDGARLYYRGHASAYSGAQPTVYETVTSQSGTTTVASANGPRASSGNALNRAVEMLSNSTNSGPGAENIVVANGSVTHTDAIDFAGNGQPDQVTFIELRSPVRQGDQYLIWDQHYATPDIDIDQDGKKDPLDVAIYARVEGMETVALPNLPALRAVRVDTIVQERLTYSSTGQQSAVVQITLSTWYAQGIGVVRQSLQRPSDGGNGLQTADEMLVGWDGIDKGFGVMPTLPSAVPPGSSVQVGAALPGKNAALLLRAVALPDRALVFTDLPGGNLNDGRIAVSRLDLNGRVLSTHELPYSTSQFNPGSGLLLAHANGLLHVYADWNTGDASVSITHLDVDGQLVNGVRDTRIDMGGGRFLAQTVAYAAAIDGSTLWLLMKRLYVVLGQGFAYELALQPFDLDGHPLAAEAVMDATEYTSISLSANGGKALASWSLASSAANTQDLRYATASLTSGTSIHTLLSAVPNNLAPLPLAFDGGVALLWNGSLANTMSGDASAHGIKLDAAGLPLLGSAGLLDAEKLPGLSTLSMPFASGRLVGNVATDNSPLYPELAYGRSLQVSWLDASVAGPLSNARPTTVRVNSDMGNDATGLVLTWPDRAMLITGDYQLSATVVWLNDGGAARAP